MELNSEMDVLKIFKGRVKSFYSKIFNFWFCPKMIFRVRPTRLFSTKTGILSKNTDKKMDKNWTLIFSNYFI
jgi:hypothetical protein